MPKYEWQTTRVVLVFLFEDWHYNLSRHGYRLRFTQLS